MFRLLQLLVEVLDRTLGAFDLLLLELEATVQTAEIRSGWRGPFGVSGLANLGEAFTQLVCLGLEFWHCGEQWESWSTRDFSSSVRSAAR